MSDLRSGVQVLEEQCAWTSDQVGDDYVWELTDADRAELEAALEHAEARTERPLSTWGAIIVEAAGMA